MFIRVDDSFPICGSLGEKSQLKGQLARVAYKLRSTNEAYKKCVQEHEAQVCGCCWCCRS